MTKLLNSKSYLIFFLLVIAVLFLRMGDINFTDGKYIWAEDGSIFINQAFSLGLESIFEPYAGYIHLYPRLVSFLSVQIGLSFLPTIFFLGWIGAVIYSGFVVFKWLYNQTDSIAISMIVPLLALLQPHAGETFFNITNAQWFLALALIVLLIDKEYKASYKNFLIFILLGLTGPFSILVLPILFLNIVFKKDLKENYVKYLLVLVTAFIQIYFMLKSNRVGGEVDPNILDWLKSVYIFFTFGTKGFFAVLSLFIWLILFIYVIKFFCDVCKKQFDNNQINGLLIIIGLFIIYFAGLWSSKQFPLSLHPLGGGARYFVIPYALLFISLPLLIKHIRVLYIVLFLIFIVDVKQFTKINRTSLNFQSFAWLSQYTQNLIIPIHPQWGISYPEWHIAINNETNKNFYPINLNEVLIANGIRETEQIKSNNNDLQLIFTLPTQCKNSHYIGLEVKIKRDLKGWSQVFYTDSANGFSEEKSLKRFYSAGDIVMQFAFENNDFNSIRFDPTENVETLDIRSINVYCEKLVH